MEHSLNVLPKWAREKILALEDQNKKLKKHTIQIVVHDTVSFRRDTMKQTLEGMRVSSETYNLQNGDSLSLSNPNGAKEQIMTIQWGKQDAGVH